jgi:hypothetical protein
VAALLARLSKSDNLVSTYIALLFTMRLLSMANSSDIHLTRIMAENPYSDSSPSSLSDTFNRMSCKRESFSN